MCLVGDKGCLGADGGGRGCWEEDGDPSPEESLRGRFFVRDNDDRSNSGVWDVGGALLESIIGNSKDEASDVVEEGFVLFTQTNCFEET